MYLEQVHLFHSFTVLCLTKTSRTCRKSRQNRRVGLFCPSRILDTCCSSGRRCQNGRPLRFGCFGRIGIGFGCGRVWRIDRRRHDDLVCVCGEGFTVLERSWNAVVTQLERSLVWHIHLIMADGNCCDTNENIGYIKASIEKEENVDDSVLDSLSVVSLVEIALCLVTYGVSTKTKRGKLVQMWLIQTMMSIVCKLNDIQVHDACMYLQSLEDDSQLEHALQHCVNTINEALRKISFTPGNIPKWT